MTSTEIPSCNLVLSYGLLSCIHVIDVFIWEMSVVSSFCQLDESLLSHKLNFLMKLFGPCSLHELSLTLSSLPQISMSLFQLRAYCWMIEPQAVLTVACSTRLLIVTDQPIHSQINRFLKTLSFLLQTL